VGKKESTQAEETLLDVQDASPLSGLDVHTSTQTSYVQSGRLGDKAVENSLEFCEVREKSQGGCKDLEAEEKRQGEGQQTSEEDRQGSREVQDEVLETSIELRESWTLGVGQTFSQTRSELLVDLFRDEFVPGGGLFVNIPILDKDTEFVILEDDDVVFVEMSVLDDDSDWSSSSTSREEEDLELNWALLFDDNCHNSNETSYLFLDDNSTPDLIEFEPTSDKQLLTQNESEPTLVQQLLTQPIPNSYLLDDGFLDWFKARYPEFVTSEDEDNNEEEDSWEWNWIGSDVDSESVEKTK